MIIIGLSAKKQGGKSTLTDYLKENLPCCETIRFADALKQIVLDCFVPPSWNLKNPEDLDTDEVKNKVLPCMRTIRNLLQTIGTDMFRNQLWEECWINAYRKRVNRSKAAIILTPDVRFPNELKIIQAMGGKVFRLLRAPFKDQDRHESEIALDGIEYDTCQEIMRTGNIINETYLLGGFKAGKVFDLIYDNRNKTLDDAKIWADQLIKKCFKYQEELDGVSNVSFDLRRISE